jgi:diacylglycerol kinase family enzyme
MPNRYKKINIICKEKENKTIEELQQFFKDHYKKETSTVALVEDEIEFNKETIYFLYLDDQAIKLFLQEHIELDIDITILPNQFCNDAILRYGISKDIYEAIDDGFNKELRVTDQLLLCNNSLVFQKISIGNVNNLNKEIINTSLFKNLKIFLQNLSNLKYQSITIQTAKNNNIQTISSGILVLEDYTLFNSLIKSNQTSFHDGKLNAFVIAPYSLLSYIYYLITIFLYHKFSFGNLPKDIGFISSKKLTISSKKPFEFTIDNISLSAKDIEIEVFSKHFKYYLWKKIPRTHTKCRIH